VLTPKWFTLLRLAVNVHNSQNLLRFTPLINTVQMYVGQSELWILSLLPGGNDWINFRNSHPQWR